MCAQCDALMPKSKRALFPFDLCWVENGIEHSFPYTNRTTAELALSLIKANGFSAYIKEVK